MNRADLAAYNSLPPSLRAGPPRSPAPSAFGDGAPPVPAQPWRNQAPATMPEPPRSHIADMAMQYAPYGGRLATSRPVQRPGEAMHPDAANFHAQSHRYSGPHGHHLQHLVPAGYRPAPAAVQQRDQRSQILGQLRSTVFWSGGTVQAMAETSHKKYEGTSMVPIAMDINSNQLATYMAKTPPAKRSAQGFMDHVRKENNNGYEAYRANRSDIADPAGALHSAILVKMAEVKAEVRNKMGVDLDRMGETHMDPPPASARPAPPVQASPAPSRPLSPQLTGLKMQAQSKAARLLNGNMDSQHEVNVTGETKYVRHAGSESVAIKFEVDLNKVAHYMATTPPRQQSALGFFRANPAKYEYRGGEPDNPYGAMAPALERQMASIKSQMANLGWDLDKISHDYNRG